MRRRTFRKLTLQDQCHFPSSNVFRRQTRGVKLFFDAVKKKPGKYFYSFVFELTEELTALIDYSQTVNIIKKKKKQINQTLVDFSEYSLKTL